MKRAFGGYLVEKFLAQSRKKEVKVNERE